MLIPFGWYLCRGFLKLSNGLLLKSEYTLILIFPHTHKKQSNQMHPYQKHLLAVVVWFPLPNDCCPVPWGEPLLRPCPGVS